MSRFPCGRIAPLQPSGPAERQVWSAARQRGSTRGGAPSRREYSRRACRICTRPEYVTPLQWVRTRSSSTRGAESETPCEKLSVTMCGVVALATVTSVGASTDFPRKAARIIVGSEPGASRTRLRACSAAGLPRVGPTYRRPQRDRRGGIDRRRQPDDASIHTYLSPGHVPCTFFP